MKALIQFEVEFDTTKNASDKHEPSAVAGATAGEQVAEAVSPLAYGGKASRAIGRGFGVLVDHVTSGAKKGTVRVTVGADEALAALLVEGIRLDQDERKAALKAKDKDEVEV